MGEFDVRTGAINSQENSLIGEGTGAEIDELKQTFEQAKKDQLEITKISVEGNTAIAASKEKPNI